MASYTFEVEKTVVFSTEITVEAPSEDSAWQQAESLAEEMELFEMEVFDVDTDIDFISAVDEDGEEKE